MTPVRYLAARWKVAHESKRQFAQRSMLPTQTVYDALHGEPVTLRTAFYLVEASKEEPAPNGGTIGYEDLVTQAQRDERRARRRLAPVASR